jgi:hypothetical protein
VTITRVGATEKYAAGWDRAFGRKKKETAAKPAARAAKHGTVAGKKPAAAKKKSAARKAT